MEQICIKNNKNDCTTKSITFKLKQDQETIDIATVVIKGEKVIFNDQNHHITKFIDHTSKVIILLNIKGNNFHIFNFIYSVNVLC